MEEASPHCPNGTGVGDNPRRYGSRRLLRRHRRRCREGQRQHILLLTVPDRLGGHHSALARPLPVPVTGPDLPMYEIDARLL